MSERPPLERLSDGRRHINLNRGERRELARQRQLERAVALFLDLEHDRTWDQIAEELGISTVTLKKLTKTKEFEEIYSAHYAELGHDPRLGASRAALVDLLPIAVRRLRKLLTDESTPPTVTLNAIKEVMAMTGVQEHKSKSDDKSELARFLKEAGVVNITQNNIVPPAYREFIDSMQLETIDGELED